MSGADNVINHETCLRCSRCVNICPMGHLELYGTRIRPVTDPEHGCIVCGHCMSVCPTRSIVTRDFDYSRFDDLPESLPVLDDFLVLLKARRSVRQYQPKPVPGEVLERILDAATTSPMSLPPSGVEVVVFGNREKIQEILPAMLDELRRWVYAFSSPIFRPMMRLMMPGHVFFSMEAEVIPLAKAIVDSAKEGKDYLTYEAPAMLLFHSSKYVSDYDENCIIAKTYAMIAAEGLGLGSCVIGMIPPAIDRNRKLRELLGIPKENEVVGCLILGYPRVTYNRSIPRDFKSVKWM